MNSPEYTGPQSGSNSEGFSQASVRNFRIFRDQHGREYQAVCEQRTGHPTGPLSPTFRAPLHTPKKYIYISDTPRALLYIHYEGWLADLTRAHEDYEVELYTAASAMYADKAAEAVADPPKALIMRVGKGPRPLAPVQAAAAGNKWVLGMSDVKPAAAEKFFPTIAEAEMRIDATTGRATQYVDPFAEAEEEITYPNHYAPGRWHLDAQHKNQVDAGLAKGFKGSREDALKAITDLAEVGADPFTE